MKKRLILIFSVVSILIMTSKFFISHVEVTSNTSEEYLAENNHQTYSSPNKTSDLSLSIFWDRLKHSKTSKSAKPPSISKCGYDV